MRRRHQAPQQVGQSLLPDGAAPVIIAAVAIVSGVLMGLVVGAITGAMLIWLLPRLAPASQR